MAAPSAGFWQRRGFFGLYELLQSWWRHRVSFLLSLCITIFALGIYYLVFGRWPFSRTCFAKLLDVLHEDHAAASAFDVTFSKPDQTAAPIRSLAASLQDRRQKGEQVDPKVIAEVNHLATEYDADTKFAVSIRHFGPVILGNYFLFTPADLQGVSDAALEPTQSRLRSSPSRRLTQCGRSTENKTN